ncbi:MAG: hypothetical protein ACJAZP_002389 [Psychromonas sp.]|jgi:hypothetical protein|uniref:hypothetical protein n=1 Tax=Psychromonas sp. TaxID=1884585 RepID=UPI0039E5A0DC
MVSKVDWFCRAVRVGSAFNPVAAVFLQLQSELDGIEINRRLDNLEDPISACCDSSPQLCKALYECLDSIELSNEVYKQYSRPLAVFESKGYLKREMHLGSPYAQGIELVDPSFTLYLARLFEKQANMSELYDLVENCNIGVWIDGIQLAESLNIPLEVVRSIFKIYVENGLGNLSNERGTCNYLSIA